MGWSPISNRGGIARLRIQVKDSASVEELGSGAGGVSVAGMGIRSLMDTLKIELSRIRERLSVVG